MNGENPRLYNIFLPKQSIKRQLHTTHVGAVGWEPHSSSTTTCAGKVDHELPASNLFFCLFSVFPLEPEKQRSQKNNNQLQLSALSANEQRFYPYQLYARAVEFV